MAQRDCDPTLVASPQNVVDCGLLSLPGHGESGTATPNPRDFDRAGGYSK
jgi:hypothetical protein